MAHDRVVKVGCGAGFWGDTPEGPSQLIRFGGIDYLVLDYLAEITMSILARMRERKADQGYATDFVTQVIAVHAKELARRGIKVVANAGGVNPLGCKEALERELARQGVALKVAAVVGDDLTADVPRLRAQDIREMDSGAALPEKIVSANAYLGGFPIAAALSAGADIVVTGRCADSALVLGPLIHEFGWTAQQHDLLAAGSLAGHVIECGPQSTGGFFTDWREISEGFADIGFPIAECRADGTFIATKPPGTGGRVHHGVIAEQVTYETGDPRRYLLPDVVCDWSDVHLEEVGKDRVAVSGARGFAPTPTYKVSATWTDGYRCLATLLIKGREAGPKARAVANAILGRTRSIFARDGLADYTETSVELLGAEEAYGPRARADAGREVMVKLAVRHDDREALEIFSREVFPTATSTVQGMSGIFGGRPKVQPLVRLYSFLLPKDQLTVKVLLEGRELTAAPAGPRTHDIQPQLATGRATSPATAPACAPAPATTPAGPTVEVPLFALAWGRSGDKGDLSNIAVIARRPEFLPVITAQLSAQRVGAYLAHLLEGRVERFDWPGLHACNFLLHQALGGGGVASLRYDPQGKAHAQLLLEFPMHIPQAWVDAGWIDPQWLPADSSPPARPT